MRCPDNIRLIGDVTEPVTLAEAKLHLRLITDITDATPHPDDPEVTRAIAGARSMAEEYCERPIAAGAYELRRSYFPGPIVWAPVQALTSVKYTDDQGATQDVADTVYELAGTQREPLVRLKYGQAWPTALARQSDAVQIRFTAGYGGDQKLPASMFSALLLTIGHLYENREAIVTGTIATEIPLGALHLLDPFRLRMGL